MDVNQYILERFQLRPARSPHLISLSRWNGLIDLFRDLGYQHGAEIGVAHGKYSEALCRGIPGLKLLCVDSWQYYRGYRDVVSQVCFDEMFKETQARLECWPEVEIMKAFSEEAASCVPNNSLDFVFIDAAHDFFHVTQDIHLWSRKVRPGGIVSGHDFRRGGASGWECHVKDVVGAWTYAHGISPWFVFTNSKSPSWFWVKQ